MWKHCEYSSWRTVPSEPRLRKEVCADTLGITTSSSCRVLPVNTTIKKKSWIIVFTMLFLFPIFPVWAIYRVGAESGWECWVLQESTTVGFWLWSLLCLARYEWVLVWACWRALCPKGNKTTAHNFLMPPTHTCTFLVCNSSKQELAMSRGNGFSWLK